ncbi:hypothetical protein IFM51744_01373 [Aspergillus udagawae]|nr:hypothetical protein IFM51744_01373 [Aspergillus udagawae]
MDELPSHSALLALVGLFCLSAWFVARRRSSGQRLPLPPGPPRLPFIGNLMQLPRQGPWKTYKKWSDQYGPLISVQTFAVPTIVIGSWDLLKNHFERKNTIYSHRPSMPFFNRVTGGLNASTMPYGPIWKAHRTLRAGVLKPSMTIKYRGIQDIETRQLLYELISTNDFSSCFRRCIASVFLTLAYGERLESETDEVQEVEEMNRQIAIASESSLSGMGNLAMIFPSLASWLPASWEGEADALHNKWRLILEGRARAALNREGWNWTKEFQHNSGTQGCSVEELAHVVGSLYEASLAAFQVLRHIVLVAVLHPDSLSRVRQEIDQVVGKDRLPQFEDIPQLPQTIAFMKETYRWRGLTPFGGPRAAFADDECMGYHIPRGATVLCNYWALNHDENIFPDSFAFKPERWLENPQLPESAFGFGQRGCPGRHMGQDSVLIATSRLFWAYDIELEKENGRVPIDREKAMDAANGTTMASFVCDFKASFQPRSRHHQEIIEKQWMCAEKDAQTLLANVNPTATTGDIGKNVPVCH